MDPRDGGSDPTAPGSWEKVPMGVRVSPTKVDMFLGATENQIQDLRQE